MKDDEAAFGVARTGIDLEQFKGSVTGRYLTEQAQKIIKDAESSLIDCDPEDPVAIRALQNDAKVGLLFISWLEIGINSGENAVQFLRNTE